MDELQRKILAYQPSDDVQKVLEATDLLLLVGPTGSGKNTLERELKKTGHFRPIVTHTTRSPRINHGQLEQEGDEYHFLNDQQAISMLKERQFIEVAYTHGHFYGTSVNEFRLAKQEAKTPVADIDIKGVKSYRQLSDRVIAVFLLPPSFQVMIERLMARYGKIQSQGDINTRLATALDELYELIGADYYHPIINDHLEQTTDRVLDIVNHHLAPSINLKARDLAQTMIADIKNYLADQTDS